MQDPATAVNAFDIDTENPTGTVSVSDTLLSDADAGGTFSVAVSYSEIMDQTVAPTITFDPDVAGSLAFSDGAWNEDGDTYTANYAVSDANVMLDNIDVSAAGAEDAQGNLQQVAATAADAFSIDTANPALAINNFTNPINAANQAAAAVDGTSEANAQIDVAVGDGITTVPGSTVADTAGAWSIGPLDLTGLADGPITYSVTATDAAGNTTVTSVSATKDTVSPTGTISVSSTLLTDADVGGTFSVTIDYSEPMDTTVAPTVSFNPDVSAALSLDTTSWTDADTYVASYVVLDGVNINDVDVSADGTRTWPATSRLPRRWPTPSTSRTWPPPSTTSPPAGRSSKSAPVTVTVSATDPGGTADPLTYEFDFDNDGTYEVSTSDNFATTTYFDNGTFRVNVRVTDDDPAAGVDDGVVDEGAGVVDDGAGDDDGAVDDIDDGTVDDVDDGAVSDVDDDADDVDDGAVDDVDDGVVNDVDGGAMDDPENCAFPPTSTRMHGATWSRALAPASMTGQFPMRAMAPLTW